MRNLEESKRKEHTKDLVKLSVSLKSSILSSNFMSIVLQNKIK